MPIRLKTVAVRDESTMQQIYEWAKACRGGAIGIAKHVCTELVLALVKKALTGLHSYQIENQVDGLLRWKKEGNQWKVFSRTGRCYVMIIYGFADRAGKVTEVKNRALVRAVRGMVEVAIINPRTGGTLKTVRTKTKTRQLSANEWAVEYWPAYKK